jgi:hypothetical protein
MGSTTRRSARERTEKTVTVGGNHLERQADRLNALESG